MVRAVLYFGDGSQVEIDPDDGVTARGSESDSTIGVREFGLVSDVLSDLLEYRGRMEAEERTSFGADEVDE